MSREEGCGYAVRVLICRLNMPYGYAVYVDMPCGYDVSVDSPYEYECRYSVWISCEFGYAT